VHSQGALGSSVIVMLAQPLSCLLEQNDSSEILKMTKSEPVSIASICLSGDRPNFYAKFGNYLVFFRGKLRKSLHSKALAAIAQLPKKTCYSLLLIYRGHIHKIMQNPENKLKKLPAVTETRVKPRKLPKFSPNPCRNTNYSQ
jgi:hypothetical protein